MFLRMELGCSEGSRRETMTDACGRLKEAIQKHFGFLAGRGFRVEYEAEWGVDGCVIGLEGLRMRMKFYTARDEALNILVGDLAAEFDRGSGRDGDAGWFYIRPIAGFVDQDLSIGERFASRTSQEVVDGWRGQAEELARLVQGHLDEIERMFSMGFERELRNYRLYSEAVDARTRAAYEARAAKL
jgi:hypothetical protein